MAAEKTKIDALGIYHTGAEYDGMTQLNARACLGGFRAGTELKRIGALIYNAMPPIAVDWISGKCGEGTAFLRPVSTNSVAFAPPGGAFGAETSIPNGKTVLAPGTVGDMAIRLTRDRSDPLGLRHGRIMTLVLHKIFENAVAHRNVTDEERSSGLNTYSALMLKNHSDQEITNVRVWVDELADETVSNVGYLGASGSGSIRTSGSFSDWPEFGWCHIKRADGSTREIVKYRKETDTRIEVEAAHRARLGTTSSAGAADDTLHCVPGVRIGIETPVSGAIQIIPDETTEPTGISWNTGTTGPTGLYIATMATNENHGLWIHREISQQDYMSPEYETRLCVQFTYATVVYNDKISGLWRMAQQFDQYELYDGTSRVFGDPPTTASLLASGDGPNLTVVNTPPSEVTTKYLLLVRRNAYGLRSLNRRGRKITFDTMGRRIDGNPSAPINASVIDGQGGISYVQAEYFGDNDETDGADSFSIYVRGDGTNPNPSTDAPVIVEMQQRGLFGRKQTRLFHPIGPFAKRAELRVLVRARRSKDGAESANVSAVTHTVGTLAPEMAARRSVHIGVANEQALRTEAISRTVYIDEANDVRWEIRPGYTDLWGGAVLIWRLCYDENLPSTNGLWTTFALKQPAPDAAQSEVLEVIAWNGSKQIGIAVHGRRRMIIDVSARTITFGTMIANPNAVRLSRSSDPAHDFTWDTCFQVWEPNRQDYFSGASLDANGGWRLGVPFRQRANVGDIP